MRGSFLIARIAGTGVYIHFTFPLLVAFYGWLYYNQGYASALDQGGIRAAQQAGQNEAIYGVIFTMLLFFCVLLHEFGHAFAARAFGIKTPDITLLPIGGVARLERMPKSPWQELVIAVAGPAVNVGIAIILILSLFGTSLPGNILNIDPANGSRLGLDLLYINIWLVMFNMIPAFPMDGGRVLRSILAMFMKYPTATRVAARTGQVVAVFFVIASFTPYGNTMLLFIAMFVFMAAQQELSFVERRAAAQGNRVGDIMITRFETVPENIRAGEMRAILFQSKQDVFPMVDSQRHLRGLLTRENISASVQDLPAEAPINCALYPLPSASPEIEIDQAIRLLRQENFPLLGIVDTSGQLKGLVGLDQLISVQKMKAEESL